MKNLIYRVAKNLIEKARSITRASRTRRDFNRLMKRLRYVDSGGHFNRDQMNER
jgi:hypothetical protein